MYSEEPFVKDPNEMMLRDLLAFHKVNVFAGATFKELTDGDAVIKTAAGEKTVPAGTVILSVGYNPDTTLRDELKSSSYETYILGDCKSVQNILSAIWESYEVARFI